MSTSGSGCLIEVEYKRSSRLVNNRFRVAESGCFCKEEEEEEREHHRTCPIFGSYLFPDGALAPH